MKLVLLFHLFLFLLQSIPSAYAHKYIRFIKSKNLNITAPFTYPDWFEFENFSFFLPDSIIGQGRFATVHALLPNHILKIMRYTDTEKKSLLFKYGLDSSPLIDEIEALKRVNLFVLERTIETSNGKRQALIQKLVPGKLLYELIDNGGLKSELDMKSIQRAIKKEIDRVHSLGIVHGDIHQGNVLFVKHSRFTQLFLGKFKATLIDFGLSEIHHTQKAYRFGRVDYLKMNQMLVVAQKYMHLEDK